MRLIDADVFKTEWHMANECQECKQDARICQYDVIFTRMDVCDMIDSAPTVTQPEHETAPVMVPHSRGIAWNCGYCGTEIDVVRDTVSADAIPKMHLYCRMCGGRIKW